MTRRGDPGRIYQAQRAGIFARLHDEERVNQLDAERLIARWEQEAEGNGISRDSNVYWSNAWDWITEQRKPKADKKDMSAVGDDGQVFGG